MPCKMCKITKSQGKLRKCHIVYCQCGCCNHCHIGGVKNKHWFDRYIKLDISLYFRIRMTKNTP